MGDRTRAACLLMGLIWSLGCFRKESPVDRHQQVANAVPQQGGTLLRRLRSDIVTLNPVRTATAIDRYVHKYLYTPIIYLDQNLQPAPGLAVAWTISSDGLVYRLTLNEKATFSDGSRVRAGDVLFTLRKIVDPATEAPLVSGFFEQLDLARTRVVTDQVIDVAFRQPMASQLIHFADVFVLPEHVYAEGNFNSDFNDLAVGSGPYQLIKHDRGKEIILERRQHYWNETPRIQTVVFKVIADHGTAWNALRLGQLDETIVSSDTWFRERTNPALATAVNFRSFYTLNYNFIAWNNQHPLLADKLVRRALAMCVPTESLIRDVYHGTARAISGPFTPAEYAFNPSVPVIGFDPATAKQLFAAAGWLDRDGDAVLDKNGTKFELEMLIPPGSAATTQFAQAVQGEMKKVGVKLEIRTMDSAAQVQQLRSGNFDAAYLAWELDADADPYSLFHSSQFPPRGQNFVLYANPEVDRLIEAARRELDTSKRKDLYWQLHKILAEDQPYTWTVQVSMKWGFSKRLRGVSTSPAYGLFNWYPGELGWWISSE